jgi:hypothetical protein
MDLVADALNMTTISQACGVGEHMCSSHFSGTNATGLLIPAKRYRIGELVRYSPFSRQTIHNYTIMGLIREAEWTTGGHRLYDESVFERLSRIVELKKTKSLIEIRRILREEEKVTTNARDNAGGEDMIPTVT